MPFGRVFGAVFFGFCAWFGLRRLGSDLGSVQVTGALLAGLGVLLALALLTRAAWPRWVALGGALVFAALAITSAGSSAGSSGHGLQLAVAMAGVASALLLAVPATGRVRPPANGPQAAGGSRLLGSGVALCVLALVLVTPWAYRAQREAQAEPARAASLEIPRSVRWSDYGSGLERARREGKPLLVEFVASWCGYCKKMDHSTWKHPSVVERLDEDVVAVRVDTDDTREVNGYVGAELAGRYRIEGTPTMLLLDHDGGILARTGGYQEPAQLLNWLERSLRGSMTLSRTRR